jgi:hypothetical protein
VAARSQRPGRHRRDEAALRFEPARALGAIASCRPSLRGGRAAALAKAHEDVERRVPAAQRGEDGGVGAGYIGGLEPDSGRSRREHRRTE